MEFIIADKNGIELGFFQRYQKMDFDIGKTNDFELTIPQSAYEESVYIDNRIYAYDTEYGGIIKRHKVNTEEKTIALCGYTWRGMLANKIIEPPAGTDYRVVSGEANSIIAELINNCFDGLIIASLKKTQITIKNYQLDRYCSILDGLQKMFKTVNAKIVIRFDMNLGCVIVGAESIVDYSDTLEYSQDQRLSFIADNYQMGVNHLICLGKGELADRQVIHLYMQKDGTVGKTQYFKGLDEIEAIYDYSSVESIEELESEGTEKLLELANYKSLSMNINEINAEIGDIVGGRERITGMYTKKPIINKIFRIESRKESIEFKLEGSD